MRALTLLLAVVLLSGCTAGDFFEPEMCNIVLKRGEEAYIPGGTLRLCRGQVITFTYEDELP